MDLIDKIRVLSYLNVTETCWLWKGTKSKTGYGVIRIDGKTIKAHRAVTAIILDRDVEFMPLQEHSCENKLCCNVEHLFDSDHRNNNKIARGWKLIEGKWYCKRNHLLEDSSLKLNGNRIRCRACANYTRRLNRIS